MHSVLSATVLPEERLTRYIFDSGYFSIKNGAKPGAFLPNNNGKTSVYRTSGIIHGEVWEIGRLFVEAKRKDERSLKARADLAAGVVFDAELDVTPETSPHPRHANIEKWPGDKSKERLKAVLLSNKSSLFLP